jgi:glycerol-3-phosphate cytidylyltransferase-like family protein
VDTRSKILSEEGGWPDFARPLAVATGYFDVLRAAHVRDLQQARDAVIAATLLVIVMPREIDLLPVRARAELVAGLRIVDYVVCGSSIEALRPDLVVKLENKDNERLRDLRASAGAPSGSAANK